MWLSLCLSKHARQNDAQLITTMYVICSHINTRVFHTFDIVIGVGMGRFSLSLFQSNFRNIASVKSGCCDNGSLFSFRYFLYTFQFYWFRYKISKLEILTTHNLVLVWMKKLRKQQQIMHLIWNRLICNNWDNHSSEYWLKTMIWNQMNSSE